MEGGREAAGQDSTEHDRTRFGLFQLNGRLVSIGRVGLTLKSS